MGIQGKILIVDDEKEALENCRRILSRVPYECMTASDPGQALELMERERPGLVLTDLRMPKLDGIEVLTAAKRMDPAVQVVLLTAHATIADGGDVDALRSLRLHYQALHEHGTRASRASCV